MDISLAKLLQLVVVAKTGSFSRAASELNMSQPALSRSISTMEDRYGFQFFNRVGHGVQLTTAGAQVVEQAGPLLQDLRIFEHNLRMFGSGRTGTLAVGLSPLLASQLLAGFACEFVAAAEGARLQVVIQPGEALLEKLRSDAIEFFLFPEGYIDDQEDIGVVAVGSIKPVCVVRAGHPLTGMKSVGLEHVAAFPWASAVNPPIAEELLNPVRFTCDNYHILRDAVLASDLVCICSKAFVSAELAEGRLQVIQVTGLPLPETVVYRATLRGRVLSPLAEEAAARFGGFL